MTSVKERLVQRPTNTHTHTHNNQPTVLTYFLTNHEHYATRLVILHGSEAFRAYDRSGPNDAFAHLDEYLAIHKYHTPLFNPSSSTSQVLAFPPRWSHDGPDITRTKSSHEIVGDQGV